MLHQENFDISGTRAFYERIRTEMRKTPDALVMTANDETLTYDAVLGLASRVRGCLPGPGVGATEAIAICAEKTPACLAAVLAVQATGRAYAPLDPTHPDARILDILDDLQPAALVVDKATLPRFAIWAHTQCVPLIDLSDLPVPSDKAPGAQVSVSQQSLAAMLHTSGSTGKPKRVEIEANALHVFQEWVVDELSLRIDDCVLSHAPFAFDLSFLDIYASLMSGAGLVLADAKAARNGARLMTLMDQKEVTIWHSAPSALKLIAETASDRTLPNMRCVLFAGEPMPARTLQKLFQVFPNARFINIYGCTETNDTFFYDVPRQNTPDPLPLGRALPYVDFVMVDAAGKNVAGAGEGELWVRCPTMMRGYSDADLTVNAMAVRGGHTYYRSGDQVRRDETGMIHYVGRNDTLVKMNGVRVDLNEIDAVLQSHPAVKEATSYLTQSGDGKVLNAWVATEHDDINSLDLRLHLMKRLPTAAIPRNFTISLLEVPKNSNGKACRRHLAQYCNPAHA